MSDQSVDVRVVANTGDLQKGMEQAPKLVEQASQRMRAAYAALRGQTQAETSRMVADTKKVGTAMDDLMGSIKGVLAGFLGFQAVKGLSEAADQAALSAARMKQVTGGLREAAEASRALFEMSQRLQAPFAETQAMFARLMPAVAELKGGVREAVALSEILVSTAKLGGASAAEAAAGAQQFAQALGSGVLQGDELKSILENNSVLARELAGALGVGIGELRKLGEQGKLTSDLVANALLGRADDIKAKMGDLPQTVGGALTQVSNAAQQLWATMNSGGGILATVARIFSEVAKVIELVMLRLRGVGGETAAAAAQSQSMAQAMGSAFAYIVDAVSAALSVIGAMGDSVGAIFAAINRALAGDFKGAGQILSESFGKAKGAGGEALDALQGKGKALQAYLATLKDVANYSNEGRGAGGAANGFAQLQSTAPAKKPGKAGEASAMPQYEAELAKRIATFEQSAQAEGTLRQYARQEEAVYWKEVSARAGVTAEDKARAEKKWRDIERDLRREAFEVEAQTLKAQIAEAQKNTEERIRLAEEVERRTVAMYGAESKEASVAAAKVLEEKRKGAQQRAQLEDVEAQRKRDKAMADIDAERQAAQLSVQLGLTTKEELLALELQFEERRNAIRLQALQVQLAQTDPNRDPVAYQQVLAQIEQLEAEHLGRMAGLRGQSLVESQTTALQIGASLEGAFANVFSQIGTGIQSVGGLLRGLFGAVLQTVTQMLAQLAAKYLVNKLLMKGINKVAAVGEIMTEAGKAGAGGVASMAAAPFPLNLSAPAFGASMSALAMGFLPMASAAGGYDIPAGVNPLTQLHAREMVLPAKQADVIRDMADGGGGGGGPMSINLSVSALDGADVARVLMRSPDALGRAMKAAVRDAHFTPKDLR